MPGGLSEAAVRSIGQPAGQGGRYAPWQFSALAGLLAARERARTPLSIDMDKPFAGLWESARKLVEDDSADLADRLAAASLLGHSASRNHEPIATGSPACSGRGSRSHSSKRPSPAWHARATRRSPNSCSRAGRRDSPQVREAILDALSNRREWNGALLSALESERIPPGEIDPARRQRLVNRRDPTLRARAEAVFAQQKPAAPGGRRVLPIGA